MLHFTHRATLQAGLLALLGLAASACSSKPANVPAGHEPGASLYAKHCALCHGQNGTGGAMNLGPSYKGIAQFWDAERLLEYIADPKAFAANVERLGKREMTAIPDSVSPEARRQLVEYTLTLMD